jgi:hypothetical protein
VCVYSMFEVRALRWADTACKVSYRLCTGLGSLKRGKGPIRAIIIIIILFFINDLNTYLQLDFINETNEYLDYSLVCVTSFSLIEC